MMAAATTMTMNQNNNLPTQDHKAAMDLDRPAMQEKPQKDDDQGSLYSIESTTETLPEYSENPNDNSETPAKVLIIHAKGKGLLKLPTNPKEDLTTVTYPDGTVAYVSTRHGRGKDTFTLAKPGEEDLVHSKYQKKPGTTSMLRLLNDENSTSRPNTPQDSPTASGTEDAATLKKVKGKWYKPHVKFEDTRNGRVFEWKYQKSEKDVENKRGKLIVLTMSDTQKPEKDEVVLASMVRDFHTRTGVSTRTDAGNGGELRIFQNATEILEEQLIVSSCLFMLKNEVERRKCYQAASLILIVGGII